MLKRYYFLLALLAGTALQATESVVEKNTADADCYPSWMVNAQMFHPAYPILAKIADTTTMFPLSNKEIDLVYIFLEGKNYFSADQKTRTKILKEFGINEHQLIKYFKWLPVEKRGALLKKYLADYDKAVIARACAELESLIKKKAQTSATQNRK